MYSYIACHSTLAMGFSISNDSNITMSVNERSYYKDYFKRIFLTYVCCPKYLNRVEITEYHCPFVIIFPESSFSRENNKNTSPHLSDICNKIEPFDVMFHENLMRDCGRK